MANIRLIKRRIRGVKNIAQITQAMEMVAASKMKKAQEQAVAGKPYAEAIYIAVKELATHLEKEYHQLLSMGNPRGKILVVLVSTNKGLCGGLNTNLFRLVADWWGKDVIDFVTMGAKGESFIVRTGKNLVADFSSKVPFTENVPALTKLLVEGFVA